MPRRAGASSALDPVADQQSGVLSRAQLLRLGFDRGQVRNQVRARRWRVIGQVVVLHRGELTREQQVWVAVLHAGPQAALCAWTACELAGFRWDGQEAIHVVVRRGHRARHLAGTRLHESRRFDWPAHVVGNPPRTPIARSVIDAASWTRQGARACALMAAAVQQRLVRPADLREELTLAGAIRHHRLLEAALADVALGAHSGPELRFARLCRRYHLPEPQRQVLRETTSGRRYLDNGWLLPDGDWLVVEVDGVQHADTVAWLADMQRSNELVIARHRVLRVSSLALLSEPVTALMPVAEALVRFGVIPEIPARLRARRTA